jgi:hypothetical protein
VRETNGKVHLALPSPTLLLPLHRSMLWASSHKGERAHPDLRKRKTSFDHEERTAVFETKRGRWVLTCDESSVVGSAVGLVKKTRRKSCRRGGSNIFR